MPGFQGATFSLLEELFPFFYFPNLLSPLQASLSSPPLISPHRILGIGLGVGSAQTGKTFLSF
jgi:hypothetical protein